MIPFIKRRWILLSCAGVILTLSAVSLWNAYNGASNYVSYGIETGELFYVRNTVPDGRNLEKLVLQPVLHSPRFGGWPVYDKPSRVGITAFRVRFPLWIPLVFILGWIVFRELRWRETARAPALPSDAGGQFRRSHGITGDNRAKEVAAQHE